MSSCEQELNGGHSGVASKVDDTEAIPVVSTGENECDGADSRSKKMAGGCSPCQGVSQSKLNGSGTRWWKLSFIEGGDFNYLACYAVIEEAADEGGRPEAGFWRRL
jgi:hypothetical protein